MKNGKSRFTIKFPIKVKKEYFSSFIPQITPDAEVNEKEVTEDPLKDVRYHYFTV